MFFRDGLEVKREVSWLPVVEKPNDESHSKDHAVAVP